MEAWRVVDEATDYEVSNLGRVRRNGRVLKTKPHSGGYRMVNLSVCGDVRTRTVHKLVAASFIGPVPDGQEVNHKDFDPSNNASDNLEYRTHKGNVEHSCAAGRNYIPPQRYPDFKNCAHCGSRFKVNPRKRLRNKCCSPGCALAMRTIGRIAQAAASRRINSELEKEQYETNQHETTNVASGL